MCTDRVIYRVPGIIQRLFVADVTDLSTGDDASALPAPGSGRSARRDRAGGLELVR